MSSAETSQGCVSSVASCSGQRWWDLWSSLSSHLSAVITAKTQHIVQQLASFIYNVNVYMWYKYTYSFICAQISVLVQKSESPCLIVHPIPKIVSWQSTGTLDSNGRPWLTSTRKNHQGLNNPKKSPSHWNAVTPVIRMIWRQSDYVTNVYPWFGWAPPKQNALEYAKLPFKAKGAQFFWERGLIFWELMNGSGLWKIHSAREFFWQRRCLMVSNGVSQISLPSTVVSWNLSKLLICLAIACI